MSFLVDPRIDIRTNEMLNITPCKKILNLVEITCQTAIFSHQVMGLISKRYEVRKIYYAENGLFLATYRLKINGSGWIMGYMMKTKSK